MNVRLSDRKTKIRCASALLLLLFFAPHPAVPQDSSPPPKDPPKKSIGFWDLSEPKMQAMLAAPPSKQEDR